VRSGDVYEGGRGEVGNQRPGGAPSKCSRPDKRQNNVPPQPVVSRNAQTPPRVRKAG
jgi:hypothetical protein